MNSYGYAHHRPVYGVHNFPVGRVHRPYETYTGQNSLQGHPSQEIRIRYKPSLFGGYKECVLRPVPKKSYQNPPERTRTISSDDKITANGGIQGDHSSPIPFPLNIEVSDKDNSFDQKSSPVDPTSVSSTGTDNSGYETLSKYLEPELGDDADNVSDAPTTPSSRRRRRRSRSKRRKSSVFKLDEEELMQVYNQPQVGVSEEDILENLETQKEIIENVKTQPWRMGKKLKMLKLARAYVEKFEGKLSRSQGYQQKWKTFFRQLKRSYNNLVASLVPWEMRIKRIESHFGSVVASYFVFLRWLIWINIWLTFLPVCFIIIPELIVGAPHGSTERKQIPAEEDKTGADLKTIWDAEGIVKYSVIFYGYYGNAPTIGNGYRLPLAYMLTSLASFALSFIFVLKTMAANSRQSRMSTKDEHFTFSWKLFTEWDYMIGNKETANSKHASLVTTFREAILEEEEKVKEGNKHLLLFLRILANVLVLMSLALSTFIIQLFVDRSREMEIKKRQDKDYVAGFWAENELTVVMTLIATLFPNISDLISLMEKYHPRTNLRLQLARIFALNLLNLYTLFIALYNKQDDLKKEIKSQIAAQLASIGNDTVLCNSTITTTPTTVSESPAGINCTDLVPVVDSDLCWETMIGQNNDLSGTQRYMKLWLPYLSQCGLAPASVALRELRLRSLRSATEEVFKLTIMDLIFTLGQIIIIDYIRGVFIRYANSICCWDMEKKFPEYPEFKTAENLLHLINNQGVIWLGTFFAPGLAVLNMGKLMIMVYVRCWSVMVCNVPQERIFRASRSNNFYYALLLVMLFLCMLPPLFAIVGVAPSPGCGPFSNQEKMFFVLTEAMENGLPPSVNAVIDYAASPGVIIPVFLLLLMTIYYLVSVGRSLRESNSQLRMQLEYERTEGRRKVYAMADAKRETEGDGKKDGTGKNKAKKKNMSNAVSSVLAAARLAKIMSGGSAKVNSVSPATDKHKIPVAVVQGKRSLKEKVAKEKLVREAFRRRDKKQGIQNQGYEPTGEEETRVPRDAITNGVLLTMMSRAAKKNRNRAKTSTPDTVQQNIEVEGEESSDDHEVVVRQSRSTENRSKPSPDQILSSKKAIKNLLAKPKERRPRSSSRESQGPSRRSTSNTSVEIVNETVQAEVNICPPGNVKKSNSKSRHSRSRDNIDTSNTSENFSPPSSRNVNNLSAKRNISKSIPKITVEDCSDDNASVTDIKVIQGDEDYTESDSSTESSEESDDHNDNLNVSSDVQPTSPESVEADDRESSKRRFASLLTRFRESESDGASSDDQNSPDAIAARNRFASAFAKFNKHK